MKLFYLFGYECLGFQFDSNISFKISDVYPVSYNLRDMKDSGIEYEGQYALECWWFIDQAKIPSDNMFYSFIVGLNYLLFFIDLWYNDRKKLSILNKRLFLLCKGAKWV